MISRLREVFGPETNDGAGLARWRVEGERGRGVDLWLRCDLSVLDLSCEVWITRPDEDKAERCPIETAHHLDELIASITVAIRAPHAAPVHGNVCPDAA